LDFLCQYHSGEPEPDSDILELCFTPLPCLERFQLPSQAREVILRAHLQLNNRKYLPSVTVAPKFNSLT
jgi:hypothetical protein